MRLEDVEALNGKTKARIVILSETKNPATSINSGSYVASASPPFRKPTSRRNQLK
jgi:hypothetical protein